MPGTFTDHTKKRYRSGICKSSCKKTTTDDCEPRPRSYLERAHIRIRASKSFVCRKTDNIPALNKPPLQNGARDQTACVPQCDGFDRTQLITPTTRHLEQLQLQRQVALRAMEGRRPTNAQTKRTKHCRLAGSGNGNKASKFSASSIDLTHQVAKYAHLHHLADKGGRKEGNREQLGAGVSPSPVSRDSWVVSKVEERGTRSLEDLPQKPLIGMVSKLHHMYNTRYNERLHLPLRYAVKCTKRSLFALNFSRAIVTIWIKAHASQEPDKRQEKRSRL